MYCRNCGLEIPGDNWFCSRCGQGAPRFQGGRVHSLALWLAVASLVVFLASTLRSYALYQRYRSSMSLATVFGGVPGIVASVASLAAAILLILALARRAEALLTASASAGAAMSFARFISIVASSGAGRVLMSDVLNGISGLAGLLAWILMLLFVLNAEKRLLIAGACAAVSAVIVGMARTLGMFMGMGMVSATVVLRAAFLLLVLLLPAATLLARFAMPGKHIAAPDSGAQF